MTEPGAGSDLRGMKATAVEKGGDWVVNGTKHFISHADTRISSICSSRPAKRIRRAARRRRSRPSSSTKVIPA